ncbi:ABC transporter substrate-binding protein [Desulfosoma caldarium]|uniref:Osmoprotectant transport system substrate-binding protein n=1 Tax=Desulfosoma caldarium TaxID=610254 RepID=A0A3N1URZ9_9BACT|nr:glycine betaine ABC transporter substrate-binding protein [Desulfosoma caldarium]ROQ92149.1 osmoprotectant transport system substrate-binding protein [Desulfosoma caldarium]
MKRLVLSLIAVSLLAVPAFSGAAEKKLIVGSKEFTEQRILGQMMIALLEANGFKCEDSTGLGGTMVARRALESGQIDIYMEYTGTALLTLLKHKQPITDPAQCYDVVKKEDLEKNGLVWLPMMNFNNTYCIMMRRADAEAKGIKTISDLAAYVKAHPDEVTFGLNAEFYARPDGYRPLQKKYDFRFPPDKIIKMDSGLVYKALRDGKVNVSMGFSTDGRIAGFDFVVLEDDLNYFPVYNPAPVVRKETAQKYPELENIFAKLAEKLNTEEMTKLNYRVDVEHVDAMVAAKEWLKAQGLI